MRVGSLAAVVGLVLVMAAGLLGCNTGGSKSSKDGGGKSDKESGSLTIYSGRKEKYLKPVVDKFEKKTGIKTKVLYADASNLANQIIEEKNNPRGDVYVSNDVGALGFLAASGGLEKYESEATGAVDERFRHQDGLWTAASIRARVIMYNTELVSEADAPKSLEDLTDPKWKGKFGMASSVNDSMVSHVSALRLAKGDAYAEDLLRRLIANGPVLNKSHDPLRDAVGRGELQAALVNHYYFYKKKAEGAPVGVSFIDQDDFGTFVNIAGLGAIKGTRNRSAAEQFIDFVLSEEAQDIFAGVNKEIPVIDSVDPVEDVRSLDEFKQADVQLDELGDEVEKTMELAERVGL